MCVIRIANSMGRSGVRNTCHNMTSQPKIIRYVGANGIQWVFQPYEAGPYALGIVTASVSWKELKPYLK